MTSELAPERRTPWLGAVAVFLMAMIPLVGYLAPLGFAPLLALTGLLVTPTLARARPPMLPIFALLPLLAWALISLHWSPAAPHLADLKKDKALGAFTAFKLVLELGFYGAAVAALGTLSRRSARRAGAVMIVAAAALALITALDGALQAKIFQALRRASHDPIRPDLAMVKVSMGAYPLALLFWPCARILDAWRVRGRTIIIAAMAVLTIAGAHFTGADAPIAALLAGGLVWLGVRLIGKPVARALIPIVALPFIFAPMVVLWSVRSGFIAWLHVLAPPSWDARLNIWAFATNETVKHPLRGWGIDASRMFGNAIPLHTHDAAIQLWLELGSIGAALAGAFFAWLAYRVVGRTGEDRRDGAMAAATLVAYLTIGGISFGVWQEWWIALGALAAIACGVAQKSGASPR